MTTIAFAALAAAAAAGAFTAGHFFEARPGDTISVNNGGILCSIGSHAAPTGNRITCTAKVASPYFGVALDRTQACILRYTSPSQVSVVGCKYH
jgi:hypothetical protein